MGHLLTHGSGKINIPIELPLYFERIKACRPIIIVLITDKGPLIRTDRSVKGQILSNDLPRPCYMVIMK